MTEFRVGLFTLSALVAFAVAALKITANKTLFGEKNVYTAIVRDASGVFPRTSIKVAGINAGSIKSIKLHGDSALLEFELTKDVTLTPNSYLRIKTIGFLGEKYIDIILGEPTETKLKQGDLVKVQGGAGIEDLAKDASEIMVDVKMIVKKIREGVENDKSQNVIKEILANTNAAMQSVKRIITSNEEKLNNIVNHVEQLTQQLAYQTNVQNKDSLMADLKKVGPMLDDLKATSADLRIIVADVKDGKGTVGKLLRDESTVDKVNETLSSVNRLVGRINNLQADLSIYTGSNSRYDASTELNLDLFLAPERFFRLGVVQNNFAELTSETETRTSGTAGDTFENKKVIDKDKLKFNLQLGRRYQQFQVRLGLIESKGGVGVDYDIADLNTRLTAEIFDFAREEKQPAYLRVSSEIRLWNVLYTKLALEDILHDKLSYSVYGGLKFTDDDIASLLGLMAR